MIVCSIAKLVPMKVEGRCHPMMILIFKRDVVSNPHLVRCSDPPFQDLQGLQISSKKSLPVLGLFFTRNLSKYSTKLLVPRTVQGAALSCT
jgi:hypothetical protein